MSSRAHNFRHDSDIHRPYGCVIRNATNYQLPTINTIQNRSKTIAWFVSNCHTVNKREKICYNLQKYLQIEVYGACGNLNCTKINHQSANKCYDLLEQDYKFYLSFENSNCKDYVTEKLFKILKRNIIPIVYGDCDYKRIAPPNSVIIVNSFQSIKQLADYILYLNRNPVEYLKYFEWKKWYSVDLDQNKAACKLCKLLNDPFETIKVYDDIFSWWTGTRHNLCKIGNSLPNITHNLNM